TAVDAAETDEATAQRVNGEAPGWLAEELAGAGRLVHVSTDYVFAGDAQTPYDVDDEPAPRTAYGRTKLAGERAVAAVGGDAVVVRTAWVYARHGGNFVRTMTRLEAERNTVSVVEDQVARPPGRRTSRRPGRAGHAPHAAAAAALRQLRGGQLVRVRPGGLRRAGCRPRAGPPAHHRGVPPSRARPAYSVLDVSAWTRAGLRTPRPWRAALTEAMSAG
ncbi:NAD(P)-dependent oxidoreductase, partial [Modestobacter sp. VKM Ac-2676]